MSNGEARRVTLDQAFDSVNSKIQTNLFEIRSYCIEAQGIINNLVNANKSLKEENEKLRAEIEGLKNKDEVEK
jgi:cell division protein FtsB